VGLTDLKCIRSAILSVDNSPDSRGKENQGFVITLQCQIGSEFQVRVPGPLTLDLLSIPNSPEGFNFDENFTEDQKRCVDSTTKKGTFLFEYENNSTNETVLLALLGTSGNITITKRGIGRVVKVEFVDTNPTPRFDELERAILHVEKTN